MGSKTEVEAAIEASVISNAMAAGLTGHIWPLSEWLSCPAVLLLSYHLHSRRINIDSILAIIYLNECEDKKSQILIKQNLASEEGDEKLIEQ